VLATAGLAAERAAAGWDGKAGLRARLNIRVRAVRLSCTGGHQRRDHALPERPLARIQIADSGAASLRSEGQMAGGSVRHDPANWASPFCLEATPYRHWFGHASLR